MNEEETEEPEEKQEEPEEKQEKDLNELGLPMTYF